MFDVFAVGQSTTVWFVKKRVNIEPTRFPVAAMPASCAAWSRPSFKRRDFCSSPS